MKFSMKMAILSMAGVLALGGAATAASFIFTGATLNDTVETDSALVLKWGGTTNVDAVTDLTSTQSQYRQLNVDWSASSKSTGSISMTLTITDTSKSILVEIASSEWGLSSTADLGSISTADGYEATKTISVVSDLSKTLVSNTTYYLKISVMDSTDSSTVDGVLNASLAYSESTIAETVGE